MKKLVTLLSICLMIGSLSINAQVKKLSPEEKKIQDSTKKVELEMKRQEAKKKREEQMAKNKPVGPVRLSPEEKKTQDSIKRAEMQQKRTEMMNKSKSMAEQRKAMIANKKIQDSIKKAEAPVKISPSKGGNNMPINKGSAGDAKKQLAEQKKKEAAEKKEAEAQMKQAGIKGPATAADKAKDRKAADSAKKAQMLISKGKGPKAIITAASGDQSTDKLYFTLPAEALALLRDYMEETEEKDDKDFRRSFIAKEPNNPSNPGYLKLRRGNDKKYQALQTYRSEKERTLMGIEYSNCISECNNTFKVYELVQGQWIEATSSVINDIMIDKSKVLSIIKSKYKKDYKDLDLYNSRGYETSDDIFRKAMIYNISKDGNVILKDQFLDFPVLEYVWDGKDGKFSSQKAKENK